MKVYVHAEEKMAHTGARQTGVFTQLTIIESFSMARDIRNRWICVHSNPTQQIALSIVTCKGTSNRHTIDAWHGVVIIVPRPSNNIECCSQINLVSVCGGMTATRRMLRIIREASNWSYTRRHERTQYGIPALQCPTAYRLGCLNSLTGFDKPFSVIEHLCDIIGTEEDLRMAVDVARQRQPSMDESKGCQERTCMLPLLFVFSLDYTRSYTVSRIRRDTVVSDTECCAVGSGLESWRRHGCLYLYSANEVWGGHSKYSSSSKSSRVVCGSGEEVGCL
ncbi:hypothetical protein TNCV_2151971 [Trichonephila clavipes]|nr:hypothetical protein TNCV_2151971 [Trichonephila clavipes]